MCLMLASLLILRQYKDYTLVASCLELSTCMQEESCIINYLSGDDARHVLFTTDSRNGLGSISSFYYVRHQPKLMQASLL